MMAFVSSLTCESCNFAFDQPILTQQAERESICPTKKYLDKLFQGKRTSVIPLKKFFLLRK